MRLRFSSARTVLSNSRGGMDLPSMLTAIIVVGLLAVAIMASMTSMGAAGGSETADLSGLLNTAAVAGMVLIAAGIGYGGYRLWKTVLKRYPAEEPEAGAYPKK